MSTTSTTSTRTSKADRNFISFNADSIVWFAGTDQERQQEGPLPYPFHFLPDNPQEWDAIVKGSGRSNLQLAGVKAAQGRENTADFNNVCHGIALEGEFGVGGGEGDQVFTLKGGTYDVALKGVVYSDGRKSIAVIGAWSDQSTATTHDLDLSLLRMAYGDPFTVILGRVNNPLRSILSGESPDIALPPGARILKIASLGELVYWWVKRFYVLARYRRW